MSSGPLVLTLVAVRGCGLVAGVVPRNDALAKLEPSSDQAADTWKRYLAEWTAWNHVRTMASFATTAALIIAIAGT